MSSTRNDQYAVRSRITYLSCFELHPSLQPVQANETQRKAALNGSQVLSPAYTAH